VISRQARAGYARDLERIRERLKDTPVLVSFDDDRRLFVLTAIDDSQPLIKGRYQVVTAYAQGYVQARLDAGTPMRRMLEQVRAEHASHCRGPETNCLRCQRIDAVLALRPPSAPPPEPGEPEAE
jgi:hypothetical protein